MALSLKKESDGFKVVTKKEKFIKKAA